jgi:hypothetical protein
MRSQRGGIPAALTAWLTLAAVVVGAMMTVYGQFTALEVRMNEAERERADCTQRVTDIERRVDELTLKVQKQ